MRIDGGRQVDAPSLVALRLVATALQAWQRWVVRWRVADAPALAVE